MNFYSPVNIGKAQWNNRILSLGQRKVQIMAVLCLPVLAVWWGMAVLQESPPRTGSTPGLPPPVVLPCLLSQCLSRAHMLQASASDGYVNKGTINGRAL